jgi:protein-L-isoaspartate(D-aspartate) O-methyltransferase
MIEVNLSKVVTEVRESAAFDPDGLLAPVALRDLPLARALMCEQLRTTGVSNDILQVMSFVPRHGFAPPERWRVSYVDQDLWTGLTWMTSPGTIALVLDAIPRSRSNQILEIGTGSGYQTALLSLMGLHVVSIEVSTACAAYARSRLRASKVENLELINANGLSRNFLDQLFDVIVLNGAMLGHPRSLFSLLKPDGVMIVPTIFADGSQHLLRYTNSTGQTTCVDLGPCKFEPLIIQ